MSRPSGVVAKLVALLEARPELHDALTRAIDDRAAGTEEIRT